MTKNYRIYDVGEEANVADRYTLINRHGNVFGFNENPYHPQGFGQYAGEIASLPGATKGEQIAIEDLPEKARKFVLERI